MADPTNSNNPYDPSYTGGSALGDIIAGIGSGGNPVNRTQIGNYVTNTQAIAGLRTAQTEEALQKAQQMREQAQSNSEAEASLAGIQGPDGKPMFTPSQAHAVAVLHKAGGGNIEQLVAALKGGNELQNREVLSSSTATPAEQTLAQQGIKGEVAPLRTVPNAYVVPAGQAPPDVQTSPIGNAIIGKDNAAATKALKGPSGQDIKLRTGMKWDVDEDGNVKTDTNGVPQQIPNTAAGTGAVARRYVNATINAAEGIGQEVSNIRALATTDGELPDRGLTQFGSAHPGIMNTARTNLGLGMSDNTQQHYASSVTNLARYLQTVELAGQRPNQSTVNDMSSIINNPGTTNEQRMYNMGLIRQGLENGYRALKVNPDATPQSVKEYGTIVGQVRALVPYMPNDVVDFETHGNGGETFGRYLSRVKGHDAAAAQGVAPSAPTAPAPANAPAPAAPAQPDLATLAAQELARRGGSQ